MTYRYRYAGDECCIGAGTGMPVNEVKCCGGMCAKSFLFCVLGAVVDTGNVFFGFVGRCRSTGTSNGRVVITGGYLNLDKNKYRYQNTLYCLWDVPVYRYSLSVKFIQVIYRYWYYLTEDIPVGLRLVSANYLPVHLICLIDDIRVKNKVSKNVKLIPVINVKLYSD